jgi:hypothetical protein
VLEGSLSPIKIWTFRNGYIGWKQRLLKKPRADKFGKVSLSGQANLDSRFHGNDSFMLL